jgi:hypothetical protein
MQAAKNSLRHRVNYRCRVAMRLVPVAVAFSVITGCGKYYWSKPGGTVEDFYRDSQECAQKSSAASATGVGIGLDETAYRHCLRARGYTRQQHATPPAGWYRGIE